MAIIRPFRALRPREDLADKVAALPYDVMNSEEAREAVKGNPYSFLHVDKAEIDLPVGTGLYDKAVYEKARENLYCFADSGVFIREDRNALYIYRLIMEGYAQTGLVACTSIDDYLNNVIKKHEFTRADKEEDRIRHVDTTNAHTGPIFQTYIAKESITGIIEAYKAENKPCYDFVSDDGITHTVWTVKDDETIERLAGEFSSVESLYIADGHHRAASAVRVGVMRRSMKPDFTGDEEFNYFLSVLFPSNELRIMDYNRVVKDLNGMSEEEFIAKVSEKFSVARYEGEGQLKPSRKHTFGMFLGGSWYELEAKAGTYDESDPQKRLDVAIMQNNLLHPILGIEDPRTDKRIDFVGGIRGLAELERRVGLDMKVAFSMFPTTIMDLVDIADAGEVMPPKSTWFEPKLRSGLFVHTLD